MSPEDFAETLGELAEVVEIDPFEKPLRQVVQPLHEGFEDNFMRAEDSTGAPWPKRKDNLQHPLLILHGDLIEAVRDTGNAGNIVVIEDRELETGVDGDIVPYAATQNDGDEDRNIPPREYLYATEETLDRCEERFADAAYDQLF